MARRRKRSSGKKRGLKTRKKQVRSAIAKLASRRGLRVKRLALVAKKH